MTELSHAEGETGMSEQPNTTATRVKVVRTCPRCGVRAYHWGNVGGIKHKIECVSCGHSWKGRVKQEEIT